jgi:hypothetical protein
MLTDGATAPVSDLEICEAMIAAGGSFARALGMLYTVADPINQGRIRVAFADEWRNYEAFVRQRRKILRRREIRRNVGRS